MFEKTGKRIISYWFELFVSQMKLIVCKLINVIIIFLLFYKSISERVLLVRDENIVQILRVWN